MLKILVVDDEPAIAQFICRGLSGGDYQLDCESDGAAVADRIEKGAYDLILLDVMLPGIDGFTLIDYITALSIPVIFITAKASVTDRVTGLRLGADDYIVKPFEIIELAARIEAVMKRYHKGVSEYHIGDVCVNAQARTVTKADTRMHLTAREYDLLVFLCQNRDIALFRETIYERVWRDIDSADTRTLDIHISRLRQKLGWEDRLVTISRVGYRLRSTV